MEGQEEDLSEDVELVTLDNLRCSQPSSQPSSLTAQPSRLCYIVGLGLNCKFIDLLFKHSFIKFIKISLYLNFIVLEIISKQTDTLN